MVFLPKGGFCMPLCQVQLFAELRQQLEIDFFGKALVEDVKVLFVEADATKTIVTFREVATQNNIGAVAAAFGLHAISTVGHGGTV